MPRIEVLWESLIEVERGNYLVLIEGTKGRFQLERTIPVGGVVPRLPEYGGQTLVRDNQSGRGGTEKVEKRSEYVYRRKDPFRQLGLVTVQDRERTQ